MAISDSENPPRSSTPCQRICAFDDDKICVGCYRSLDEIRTWTRADEATRRSILERAEARRVEWEKHG